LEFRTKLEKGLRIQQQLLLTGFLQRAIDAVADSVSVVGVTGGACGPGKDHAVIFVFLHCREVWRALGGNA
jgi:hypothetical protein